MRNPSRGSIIAALESKVFVQRSLNAKLLRDAAQNTLSLARQARLSMAYNNLIPVFGFSSTHLITVRRIDRVLLPAAGYGRFLEPSLIGYVIASARLIARDGESVPAICCR